MINSLFHCNHGGYNEKNYKKVPKSPVNKVCKCPVDRIKTVGEYMRRKKRLKSTRLPVAEATWGEFGQLK